MAGIPRHTDERSREKASGETDVVPPRNWESWITITVMEIVIVASVWVFLLCNPLRLKA
jgi:hypothetical protein